MNESLTLRNALKLQEKGEIEKAKLIYYDLLKEDPNNIDCLNNLSLIHHIKKEHEISLEFIKKAYEKKPDSEDIVKNYILILLENDQILEPLNIILEAVGNNINKETLRDLSYEVLKAKANKSDQKNVMLFFDKFLKNMLDEFSKDKIKITKDFLNPKYNRYCSFEERFESKCMLSNQVRTNVLSETFSQGTHSAIKWKGYPVFKSAHDMALLTMIVDDLKPDTVVEIGSGQGGSAIWLTDMLNAANLNSNIYSYDKIKPKLEYEKVKFLEFDLFDLNEGKSFPKADLWKGKKLIIEDAHVNLSSVFNELDKILDDGDYFIIEDSEDKQDYINNFIKDTKKKYYVDQFYTDFFGRNGTSAVNSILKVISK
tara:strand:- start:216 stop:1325 length:1110 start_codon:yes stop_codon:yes gene_type:complete